MGATWLYVESFIVISLPPGKNPCTVPVADSTTPGNIVPVVIEPTTST